MQTYYEKRQPEYEAIYAKPERQADLQWMRDQLAEMVAGKRVLELACGTGYWTRQMARHATSIYATDISQLLADAAVASCETNNITAGTLDAFNLTNLRFDAASIDCVVAGFLYSHVLKAQREPFLASLRTTFTPNTTLIFFDNQYVEGSSTPIHHTTPAGDTYQRRSLRDGSQHDVLKNFPTQKGLQITLQPFCNQVSVQTCTYFWLATGNLRG